MATRVTVEFVTDNSQEILKALPEVKARALMMCGAIAENSAKQKCPVDTGRLRNSISHGMSDENTVDIGTDVEYAIYQELGTSRGIAPKLYLTNGVRSHISEYKQIIEEEFRKG